MEPIQALNIIRQVCASIQADLRTHEQIQAALRIVDAALQPKEVAKESKK